MKTIDHLNERSPEVLDVPGPTVELVNTRPETDAGCCEMKGRLKLNPG